MNGSWWLNTAWMASCRREWQAFHRATLEPAEAQAEVLQQILPNNANCEFGRQYGFEEIRNPREFQRRVPLGDDATRHAAIDRVAAGEPNVLTSERVLLFEPTSGTTSARKLIPYTASLRSQYQRAVSAWVYNLFRLRPDVRRGRAYWSVSPCLGERRRTSGGIAIGFDDDTSYLGGWQRWLVKRLLAVPQDVAKLTEIDDFRYATLLWLLSAEDLCLISIWSPTYATALLEVLEKWSDRLCDDLAAGRNRASRTSPLCSARRARQVRAILQSTDAMTEKLKRLWPRLALISCWADASSRTLAENLQELFHGVEVQPKGLMATEGCISFPLVGRTGAALALRSHFFEFEEVDFAEGQMEMAIGACRLAHELERGGRYSVVLTTGGGLYRYRLGDIVEVVGFENRCPLLVFHGRSSATSDYVGEKLCETHVRSVVESVLADVRIAAKFAIVVPVARPRLHYRFYLQPSSADDVLPQSTRLVEQLQQGLEQNPYYRHAVQMGQLGRIDVCLLDPQAESGWSLYQRHCLNQGRNPGALKPSFLDRNSHWVELLEPIRERHSSGVECSPLGPLTLSAQHG